MSQGKLISFEGIDGSGKSTQARLLVERLRARRVECQLLREPGGTPLGEAVRSILLKGRSDSLEQIEFDSIAETLLFGAARAELVKQVIEPALELGEVLILDRFTDSTVAYQGFGRGVDGELIRIVNERAIGAIRLDLTFLIDIDPVTALGRHQRAHDRMEREGVEFMTRVREGYLDIARREPERVIVIDGSRTVEAISKEIDRHFSECDK